MKAIEDIRFLNFLSDQIEEKFIAEIGSVRQTLDPAVLPPLVYLVDEHYLERMRELVFI